MTPPPYLMPEQWDPAPEPLRRALASFCVEAGHCHSGMLAEYATTDDALESPSLLRITAGVLVDWLLHDGAGIIAVKPKFAQVGDGEYFAQDDWQCRVTDDEGETTIDLIWPLVVHRWRLRNDPAYLPIAMETRGV